MRAIKRHWRWALAFTLVCAVLLLAWATQPPKKDLLARATRVSGVQADQTIHPYGWISGHELLLFHYHSADFWSLSRFDLVTGRDSPLPALSALYRRSGGDENGSSPRLSPDGRHFLWANRKNQVFCSDLAGGAFTHQFQKRGPASPCWLDNDHWAFLMDDKNDTHLIAEEIHDVRPPHTAQSVRLSPPVTLRSGTNVGFPRLTLTPNLRLYRLLAPFDQNTLARVDEFAVTPPRITARPSFLPQPQKPSCPYLSSSAQSPVNGRVAFALLYQPNPPPWGALLRFLRMKDTPDAFGSLCVGDPVTGKVREVGRIVVDGFVGYGPIGDVRWLPDGRHLSFQHKGALYVVPAGP